MIQASHVVTSGQTPVLDPAEARALLDSINTSRPAGLRDRALIGLMVYSFARIGAALGMAVEDVYTQNRRLWVRLREKGGKRHAMPCHHNLDEYLVAYLDGVGLRDDPKGPLFRTIGRGTGKLTRTVLPQANAYAMIRRRAAAAGIATKLGNHSFRATGITAYLKNGGTLEKAAAMANHASTRTTADLFGAFSSGPISLMMLRQLPHLDPMADRQAHIAGEDDDRDYRRRSAQDMPPFVLLPPP